MKADPTMRRRLLCAVIFGCLVVGASIWFASLKQSGPHIDREAFDAIQKGMSQKEIEAIIGVPPGDYRTGDVAYTLAQMAPGDMPHGAFRLCRWVGDHGIINVIVGPDDRMVSATCYTGVRQPFSLVSRIRRRLGL